jgi:hypothetical protein
MSARARTTLASQAIIGEPEVVEDAALTHSAAWISLKAAVTALQPLQVKDGSIPDLVDHPAARTLVSTIVADISRLGHHFPHDQEYLEALRVDFASWVVEGFGVPDFLASLVAFRPERHRVDGARHLVVFPMYTQNGSTNRHVEAVLVEVLWPSFVAALEAGDYSNALFVPIRFLDFTAGYDTNSAVLFPESVATSSVPQYTWGAIFADREAARFRRVVREAASVTRLTLPADASRLLDDQELTERTFVMWDLIHDRTHMRGDLPFDPFMIKQRMPYFLYSLEELRCDLTAFREAVKIERRLTAQAAAAQAAAAQSGSVAAEPLSPGDAELLDHAKLVQYAVLFDRIFRFAITGTRVRNYDGLGGQLLFAWLHQRGVLHWTDTKLTIDWPDVADAVTALGDAIDELYWRSIDRPKTAHWLAAYDLVTSTLTPNPASVWAQGPSALPLDGPPRGLTDAVLDDEFPLSMFYEALDKKMHDVIASTAGITGRG